MRCRAKDNKDIKDSNDKNQTRANVARRDHVSQIAASLEDSLLATTVGFLARIVPEGSPGLATTVC